MTFLSFVRCSRFTVVSYDTTTLLVFGSMPHDVPGIFAFCASRAVIFSRSFSPRSTSFATPPSSRMRLWAFVSVTVDCETVGA